MIKQDKDIQKMFVGILSDTVELLHSENGRDKMMAKRRKFFQPNEIIALNSAIKLYLESAEQKKDVDCEKLSNLIDLLRVIPLKKLRRYCDYVPDEVKMRVVKR